MNKFKKIIIILFTFYLLGMIFIEQEHSYFLKPSILWALVDGLCLTIIAIDVFINKSKRRPYISLLYVMILLLYGIFNMDLFGADNYTIRIHNEFSGNDLILIESPVLLGTTIDLYTYDDGLFMKKLAYNGFTIDDGYCPFRENLYEIEWISEKQVLIKYYGNTEAQSWKSVVINL